MGQPRTLKLTLAYDGSRYVGWQRQASGDSVQGLLENALAHFEGAPVHVHGAGRTDAGVHALGQVASVRVHAAHDAHTLLRALNAQLPRDVRVLRVDEVADDFHARYSAVAKTYRYRIWNGPVGNPFEAPFAWHVREALDVEAMQAAAALVVGTHDFSAFQSTGSDVATSVRTIVRSDLRLVSAAGGALPRDGSTRGAAFVCEPVLVYEVAGDGFLRHMVRAIVGTLVEVGRGWRSPASMAALVAGAPRASAGATAPPAGLFLVAVDYDEALAP
ncbi:MAG: tRNA pseudouridine(38-40) synthase TruA [Acidobacteria bacterium]|nr:tRNA pseudouridine(38-40) synthase TruA [Acidobacteriota bacterium]